MQSLLTHDSESVHSESDLQPIVASDAVNYDNYSNDELFQIWRLIIIHYVRGIQST